MPTVYIDDFVGVSNKLETLPMAFAIRKAFGHEIVLDWPELDSFRVEDTRRGSVRILARIGAIRVRCCDDRLFNSLRRKKIILRSLDGPAYRLDPIYMEVASRIRLDPGLSGRIRSAFDAFGDRPVVGIHLAAWRLRSFARRDVRLSPRGVAGGAPVVVRACHGGHRPEAEGRRLLPLRDRRSRFVHGPAEELRCDVPGRGQPVRLQGRRTMPRRPTPSRTCSRWRAAP